MPDSSYPRNKEEALTMLYLQNQDLSKLSPEEILDKYMETYRKIREYSKKYRKATLI